MMRAEGCWYAAEFDCVEDSSPCPCLKLSSVSMPAGCSSQDFTSTIKYIEFSWRSSLGWRPSQFFKEEWPETSDQHQHQHQPFLEARCGSRGRLLGSLRTAGPVPIAGGRGYGRITGALLDLQVVWRLHQNDALQAQSVPL